MHHEDENDAQREARLDRLEVEAFETWLEDDPGLGGPAFVERVMAAESAHLPLVLLPEPAAPHGEHGWPQTRARPWRWLGSCIAAAALMGTGTYVALRAPSTTESDPGAPTRDASSVAAPPSTAPLELGRDDRPRLPLEGRPGVPVPADLDGQIKAYLSDYGRNWGPAFQFHGVVVVARAGEVLYARGFGVAKPDTGTPNGPGTRFRVGMLTEQFTAAALLELRDAGVLSLHDPVTRFIPELHHAEGVTLEHLLLHRSGLPNYTDLPGFHAWKSESQSESRMMARLAELQPTFTPGSGFLPSNTGYFLLGVVLSRVTGRSYGDLLETSFFGPLDMRASGFGDAYETGEQAIGSVWTTDETLARPEPIDMSAFGGAAGLVSSALDLVRWDHALHAGEILRSASVDEMVTDHGDGYGYGFALGEGYGQRIASFPAMIDGFNGAMVRFLEDRTLVVVLSNNEVIPGMRVAQDVAAMVYGDRPKPRVEPHAVEIAPGTFPRFLGEYGFSAARGLDRETLERGPLALLEHVRVGQQGDRLYLDVPNHGRSWMHPMGHHRFFFKDHAGTTASFDVGPNKQAVRMIVHYPEGDLVLDRR